MSLLDHVKFNNEEIKDISLISVILGFMFSVLYMRFESADNSFVSIFILFTVFFIFLLGLRMYVMKCVSTMHGFEITLRQSFFDKFGLRSYDKISDVAHRVEKKLLKAPFDVTKKVTHKLENVKYKPVRGKGIPMPILSLLIYALSLGLFIFPSVWRYKVRKINALFDGTMYHGEVIMDWNFPINVSGIRMSRVLFAGYFYYFALLLVLKYFLLFDSTRFYWWIFYSVFWIALISLIPIPGTEGYDLFDASRFAWISSIAILIMGMIALLIFNSLIYLIIVLTISTFVLYLIYMDKFVHSH